jgi:hypothetical protein
MPKYKLTTNLIADCMALIPQNLELLNKTVFPIFNFNDYEKDQIFCVKNEYGKFDELSDFAQFLFLSHCLRTIPKFQVEDLEIHKYSEYGFEGGIRSQLPKTIAGATLHGQGEFPPITLEELCESYENVMSK